MTGIIVGLGEVLLRLAPPGRKLLRHATSFDVEVGGAEANVLAAVAALGHRTRLLTGVPANSLGDLAMAVLSARGIGLDQVVRRDNRMGLYFFHKGHGRRPSRVVYDRAGSAFASLCAEDVDLDEVLRDASVLHLSGITPALGETPASLALALAHRANALGVPVCFDGNFRAQLWQARGIDPRPVLAELIGCADVMIGNHRDIALVTGIDFADDGETRRAAAARAAFSAFPRLRLLASTARRVIDSDCHGISARVESRDTIAQTEEVTVEGIVDRIGTGDAFAAGVLDAWLGGGSCEVAARAGLALSILKHGVEGDTCQFERAELADFWQGGRDVAR